MGKHETSYARVPRDAYLTPAWCVDGLAEYMALEGRKIWEWAANSGVMVRALEARGAKVFASDIDSHPGLDAVFDFLSPGLPPGLGAFDGMVTNPAWGKRNKLAEKFIEVGLARISKYGGFLALLLPIDFDSAVTRLHLFHDPRFVARISLTDRPVWFERSDGEREAPKENCAWFVWSRPILRHPGPPLSFHAVSRRDKEATKRSTNRAAQIRAGNQIELGLDAAPIATVSEESAPIYNVEKDIWDGAAEAYELIRQRVRDGGKGWLP